MSKALLISAILLLNLVLAPTLVNAVPMDNTTRWYSGYHQGLHDIPLKGNHTAAFTAGYDAGQIAFDARLKTHPSQYGYYYGVVNGKGSARDSGPVCGGYNSTADANECYHAYSLGFKKGCQLEGNKLPIDPYPEYGQCRS